MSALINGENGERGVLVVSRANYQIVNPRQAAIHNALKNRLGIEMAMPGFVVWHWFKSLVRLLEFGRLNKMTHLNLWVPQIPGLDLWVRHVCRYLPVNVATDVSEIIPRPISLER